MFSNSKTLKVLANIVATILTFFSIIFLFFPFKLFFHLPASLVLGITALVLFVYTLNVNVQNNQKRRFPLVGIIITFLVTNIAFITIFTSSNEVERDVQFESKNDEIKENVESSIDLQEALEDIDESELEELISDELNDELLDEIE